MSIENNSDQNFQILSPSASELIKMTKAMVAGDSHIIYATLTVDGEEILSESNFDVRINQKVGSHDEFEITCPTEALEGYGAYPLAVSRKYLGKSITIELKQFGSSAQLYTGIISSIRHRKFDGFEGHIIISGHSPTILLENGQDCQSYENRTLKEIIEAAVSEYPQDVIKMNAIPALKEKLLYTVQYKETDFDFLNRMAVRYGEWFYYNGQQLVFGPADGRIIELVEEQDLYEFELKIQIVPQKFSYTGYSDKYAEQYTVKSDSENVPDPINPFQNHAIKASEDIYGKVPQAYVNQYLDRGDSDLRDLVKRQKEKRQNTVFVEGRSNNPNLRLGDRAKITAYMPDNRTFGNGGVPIETYKIIEIHHHHDGLDGYYNTFVGIPYRNVPSHSDEQAVPLSEEQSAVVADNNDPKGMGRIRVQFAWQKQRNEKTPWTRIIQQHSGGGKGSYFIPELGEEVLVGFEGGNAEKPVVLGMHYNGQETSGYHTAGNDQKVIQTRSGTKIIMNDAAGSIFIEDPSGNTWLMDGAGNISVNAPKNFSVTAGENINMSAGKNISVSAGDNISNAANENIISVAGTDIIQNASGEIRETSDMRIEMVEKDFKRQSETSNEIAGEVSMFSENENMTMQSGKIVEFNSAEKSKLF